MDKIKKHSGSTQWRRGLLILLLGYIHCANASNDTLIVGSKDMNGGTTSNNGGPAGDGYATNIVSSGGASQLVIPRAANLQSSNITLSLGRVDTSQKGGTGVLYCAQGGTMSPITLTSHFVPAPVAAPEGHKLFKTNITGLYFRMHMTNVSSWKVSSDVDIYVGDSEQQSLALIPEHTICEAPEGSYVSVGGFGSDIKVEFYNDNTFNPGTTGSVELLSNGPYHYELTNLSPGNGIFSKSIFQKFDLTNITLSSPTCQTATLSGNSVTNGDTVSLGEYSPKEVIDGANSVPFSINLQNCYRVTNIEVKLTTASPATSPSLLGNTLTTNNARGVGVEIKGATNSHFPETILEPNNISSVYKAYADTADASNGIIGTGADGTPGSQVMNFTATLKQDGNQQIVGGDFKATATFSITYP